MSNGTVTGGAGTPSITFSAGFAGPIGIGVTIQNASGCSASASQSVVVNSLPSAAIAAAASVCSASTGNVASVPDGGPSAVYTWSVSSGTITAGSGTRSVTFTAGAARTLGLTVTVQTAASCVSSGSQNVTVNALPNSAITAPAMVCAGSAGNISSVTDGGAGAVYIWTATNGTITAGAGTRSVTVTAGAAGTMGLDVSVQTSVGCIESGSQNVAVNALPSAAMTAPSAICAGSAGNGTSVVDAGAGAIYTWTATNGTITAGAGTRSVTFTAGAAGTLGLIVSVQTTAGCVASGSSNVAVNTLPNPAITASAAVCASSSGNAASVADAGVGAVYTWTISNATITSGIGTKSIVFTASATGTVSISVVVRTGAGCVTNSSRSVGINALPSAAITAATSVKKNWGGYVASISNAGTGATYTCRHEVGETRVERRGR